tara:strand:- start:128 stop:676 length:549 start_codon:yes stop_codon:yes gene_type:complete
MATNNKKQLVVKKTNGSKVPLTTKQKLEKPFSSEQIKWRAQRTGKKKDGSNWAFVLAYVDVRTVQDRLNSVLGLDGWQCKHEVFGHKTICHLGVKINGDWIWRSDGAGDTKYEADKGALSDSLKRASVLFGIGRHLYDLPSVFVKCDDKGKFNMSDCWEQVRRKSPSLDMTKNDFGDLNQDR